MMPPIGPTPGPHPSQSASTRAQRFFEGPPGSSDELLPDEIWSALHALLDPRDQHTLARVDRNLSTFLLPAAQANLDASNCRRKRALLGPAPLRRSALLLRYSFENPLTGQRYLQKMLAVVHTMGSGCSETEALETAFAAICGFLPQVPRAQARSALSQLVMQIKRGCEQYADKARSSREACGRLGESVRAWGRFLERQFELVRQTDRACGGLFGAQGWARVDASVRASLAPDPP